MSGGRGDVRGSGTRPVAIIVASVRRIKPALRLRSVRSDGVAAVGSGCGRAIPTRLTGMSAETGGSEEPFLRQRSGAPSLRIPADRDADSAARLRDQFDLHRHRPVRRPGAEHPSPIILRCPTGVREPYPPDGHPVSLGRLIGGEPHRLRARVRAGQRRRGQCSNAREPNIILADSRPMRAP